MTSDAPCIFCAIVAGDAPAHLVLEDEHAVAFLDIAPANDGHTLVIPRRHVTGLHDADPEDLARVAALAARVDARLRDVLAPDGTNLFLASGVAAWQTVFHLHLHVVPRWDADALRQPWTPAPGDPQRLREIGARLRA